MLFTIPGWGQAKPTASRSGALQLGGGYTIANLDYTANSINGYTFYGDFDFKNHLGAEVDFHQLRASSTDFGERTYEVGARYKRDFGSLTPYFKGLYGRGVLNYPFDEANLGYNLVTLGGGADISVRPRISVRADFEYQRWLAGPGIHHGITPSLLTFGVAYRFGTGRIH